MSNLYIRANGIETYCSCDAINETVVHFYGDPEIIDLDVHDKKMWDMSNDIWRPVYNGGMWTKDLRDAFGTIILEEIRQMQSEDVLRRWRSWKEEKKKAKKMTVEEIEKQLGYKVEIISYKKNTGNGCGWVD